jgi:hypothetical protein
MDSLSVMEDHLGDVEIRPTCIMLHMFVEKPSVHNVKNVAAFMYSNDVPVDIAVLCFNACNGAKHNFVRERINEWYYVLNRYPYKSHKAEYCSICLKSMVWVN